MKRQKHKDRNSNGRKQEEEEEKGDVKPGGVNCHNSEGAGVLVTVVMVTMGQTQEAAGGDDVTRAK